MIGSLAKATKPEPQAPNFRLFHAGDKNKDLLEVIDELDKKTMKQTANKEKSKQAYAVKNHFKSTEAQRKKAKQVKKKEKPPMFKSAEDEVNAYMAELGLL